VKPSRLNLPAPRPTAWAGIVFGLRYGGPVILAGIALDVALWLLAAP
jgi:hypothetical protein